MGGLRSWIRRRILELFDRVLDTDEGRRSLARALRGQLHWRRGDGELSLTGELPYAELAHCAPAEVDATERSPIFITARFRSGSTLLWNIFRQCPGVTAYYEPLNERRWFDPRTRGEHTDRSHRGVDDYWREYQGMEDLGRWYNERWIDRQLLMDAGAWDPDLREYIEQLIRRAPGRPVLQFNRVDFRLAWLRRQFPTARVVHLYRHPRDQWLSTFLHTPPFPPDGRMEDYWSQDEFYLRPWVNDLVQHFPFLDEAASEHPYQLFYYLWRLSYAFGKADADVSIAFEDLVTRPRETLRHLFVQVDLPSEHLPGCMKVIETPRLGRWRGYADHDWFAAHELRCEQMIADFVAGNAPTLWRLGRAPWQADAAHAE